jgi:hypothetical protein
MTRAANLSKLVTDANLEGTLDVTGVLTGTSLDISGDIDVDGTTNLDVVDIDGAVDMASTLGVAGVVTANAGVVVDNITIDGTEIDLSSGDLTLDVAGDIILDADGGDVSFRDAGTGFLAITNSSNDAVIHSVQNDKDMIFTGTDGGSTIEAMRLDMSEGGKAGFGTTSPAFKLQVSGTNTQIGIESTSTNQNCSLYYTAHTANQWEVGVNITAGLDYEVYDRVNNASRFVVGHDGNVTIANGNLVVASGHGIDFSATGGPTSGSGSTELFDDYEEGTFTPILQNTGGVQVGAYSIQVGFYTKIGRMVHANVVISANGLGSAGTSNVILLGGLPYDSLSSTNHDTAISVSHAVNLNITAGQNLGGFLPANSTNIRLSLYDSTQGTTDFTFGELSTDGQIKVSIQYNTA